MVLPTNIADGVAAARDGKLGAIEEVMIGDILVSALTGLFRAESHNVTRKPIQDGFDVTNAAVKQPVEISFDIVLANPDYSIEGLIGAAIAGDPGRLAETWRDKRDQLYELFELKEIITIQSHDFVQLDMMIQSIVPLYDSEDNWDAWLGTVNFVEIKSTGQVEGGLIDQAKQSIGGL